MNIHEKYNKVMDIFEDKKSQNLAFKIRHDSTKELLDDYEEQLKRITQLSVDNQKAIDLLKKISDDRTNSALEVLQNTVNWALENIKLAQKFEIVLDVRERGDSKVLNIVLNDLEKNKQRTLKHQSGTAVRQIISFLLQMSIISISGASKIVILDEVLSGLQDKETIRMFGEIIVALAVNDGFQFIFVEHKSELHEVEGITQLHLELNRLNELKLKEVKMKVVD